MTVPVLESYDSAYADSGTSQSVTKPTGTVEDDLLIGFPSTRKGSGADITAGPTGFNEDVDDTGGGGPWRCQVWSKVAGGSEPSSYAWTADDARWLALVARISGADTGGGAIDGVASADGDSDTATFPDLTTTVDDCLILRFVLFDDGSKSVDTAPSGLTEEWVEIGNTVAGRVNYYCWSEEKASAGSVGTDTAVFSGSEVWIAFTVAIAPAGGGGGGTTIKQGLHKISHGEITGLHPIGAGAV